MDNSLINKGQRQCVTETESPDYNFALLKGRMERIAANRVALCIMTEFGLMNNRKMNGYEFNSFIKSLQLTTGNTTDRNAIIGNIVSVIPAKVIA